MFLLVQIQRVLSLERFITQIALPRFLLAVRLLVPLQVGCLRESASANQTFEQPFAGMRSHVNGHQDGLREPPVAHRTDVRPHAGMRESMFFQLQQSNEQSAAMFALVSFRAVRRHVHADGGCVAQHFAADGTLMRMTAVAFGVGVA